MFFKRLDCMEWKAVAGTSGLTGLGFLISGFGVYLKLQNPTFL